MNAAANTEPYDSAFDVFKNRKLWTNNERTADRAFIEHRSAEVTLLKVQYVRH